MNDQTARTVADALELLTLNQEALSASIEEIALYLLATGATELHTNIEGALTTLDTNAQGISSAIRKFYAATDVSSGKTVEQRQAHVDDLFSKRN